MKKLIELWNSFVKIVVGLFNRKTKPLSATKTDNPIPVSVPIVEPEKNLDEEFKELTTVKPLPDNTPSKEEQFVKALSIVKNEGFDPLIVYSQACLETNAFQHLVGVANYFGMKPRKGWEGKTICITTHEVINGERRKVNDWFCDFPTASHCLIYYIEQIKRLYKDSYKNRKDYKLYFHWLVSGRFQWATDNSYAKKLITIYEGLKEKGIVL